MTAVLSIARSVLLEAVRRKELYAIVLVSVSVIVCAAFVRFFRMEGVDKFFRETAIMITHLATALTVIVLAARQLPREFEQRTIYPLLAKPIGRISFLLGKFVGVLGAGYFCYSLFVLFYLFGIWWIGVPVHWLLFVQCLYLQALALAVVAALAFVLSLLFNKDAAITIAALLYGLGQTYTTALDYVYDVAPPALQSVLLVINFVVPQFSLYDLSAKVVHANAWGPIPGWVLWVLSGYTAAFLACFLGGAYLLFRRRPL